MASLLHILLEVPGFPGYEIKCTVTHFLHGSFISVLSQKKLKSDTLSPCETVTILLYNYCVCRFCNSLLVFDILLGTLDPIFVCKSIQFQLTISLLKRALKHQASKSLSLHDFSLCLVFSTVIWSLWQSPHKTNVKGHKEIFQDAFCKPDFLRPF